MLSIPTQRDVLYQNVLVTRTVTLTSKNILSYADERNAVEKDVGTNVCSDCNLRCILLWILQCCRSVKIYGVDDRIGYELEESCPGTIKVRSHNLYTECGKTTKSLSQESNIPGRVSNCVTSV